MQNTYGRFDDEDEHLQSSNAFNQNVFTSKNNNFGGSLPPGFSSSPWTSNDESMRFSSSVNPWESSHATPPPPPQQQRFHQEFNFKSDFFNSQDPFQERNASWSPATSHVAESRYGQNNVPNTAMTLEQVESNFMKSRFFDTPSSDFELQYQQPVGQRPGMSMMQSQPAIQNPSSNVISDEEAKEKLEKERELKRAARIAKFFWKPIGTLTVEPIVAGPNQTIQVNWVLPLEQDSPNFVGDDDWIGLFHARTGVDSSDIFILSRKVEVRPRVNRSTNTVHGYIKLRTPRGVGNYDFRYFRGNPENLTETDLPLLPLARSNPFTVEVQGHDLFEALDFIQRNMNDRKKLGTAILQFGTLLQQLHSLSHPEGPKEGGTRDSNSQSRGGGPARNSKRPQSRKSQENLLFDEIWDAIQICMSQVHKRCSDLGVMIDQERPHYEDKRDRFNKADERRRECASGEIQTPDVPSGMMSDEEFNNWKSLKDTYVAAEKSLNALIRERSSISSAMYVVLNVALKCSALEMYWKPHHTQQLARESELYCPVDEIFHASPQALKDHYASVFGVEFRHNGINELRSLVDLRLSNPQRIQMIEVAAIGVATKLMPTQAVEADRLAFVDELQCTINELVATWHCDAKLVPFGSSINNFGTGDSDLDMSLVFYASNTKWPEALQEEVNDPPNPQETVRELGRLLGEQGFTDIDDSRMTARIPVLQFMNSAMELECDICIDNRLAIRNSMLLRTYSLVDIRVRYLAYVIKTWSKRRRINNPSDHTLSSYGYILLLIAYLQRLPVPLLPALQSLPVNWNGSDVIVDNETTRSQRPNFLVTSQDDKQHDTYFYGDPHNSLFLGAQKANCAKLLQNFAAQNKDSVGQLLLGFYWTYAFGFDWRRHVVGIRDHGTVLKETKANEESWKLHARMAIEDPFETGYDVAHVVRDKEFRTIREEFVRGYAILSGSSVSVCDPSHAIQMLCSESS